MADLLPSQARKASDIAPRNENERRIIAARAGHAALNAAFAAKPAQKAAQPTAPAPSAFLSSGFGGPSNMVLAQPSKVTKADALAGLPHRVQRMCDPLDEGQKAFVALVYARHRATGEPVSFTTADAAEVMGLPQDRAFKTVEALVRTNLIVARHNSIGGLAGYVPGVLA